MVVVVVVAGPSETPQIEGDAEVVGDVAGAIGGVAVAAAAAAVAAGEVAAAAAGRHTSSFRMRAWFWNPNLTGKREKTEIWKAERGRLKEKIGFRV